MTETSVRGQLEYYGLEGEVLEGCLEAYMERVADGNPADLAEFAEAYAALG